MANKTYQGRIVQKHDSSANWAKATNFIPLKGEIIVYDDLNKIKIGDGTTKVNDLDFSSCLPDGGTTGQVLIKTANGQEWADVASSFSTASSRNNIVSGEKLSVLFGKIAKWFSDLGTLAFKDKVAKTDLTTEVQNNLNNALTKVFFVGTTAPSDTRLLWVDTTSNSGLKYYNGSAWVTMPVCWGD